MRTTPALPGVEPARSVLGLVYGEIARAVQADECTLYRWRKGQAPTAVYLSRLERLDELVREIRRTMGLETIRGWMDRPIAALDGETPRGTILKERGRARNAGLPQLRLQSLSPGLASRGDSASVK